MGSTAIDAPLVRKAPALDYYRTLEGEWGGQFAFVITDWLRLWRAPTAWTSKLSVATMSLVSKIIGPATMRTTLRARGEGSTREFSHTTRVSKWSIVLFKSAETIVVDDDGRTLRMVGEQWQLGRLGRAEPLEANGEIDETATRATYRVPWMAMMMTQRTAIVAEGLELQQETSWSRGSVLLVRVST